MKRALSKSPSPAGHELGPPPLANAAWCRWKEWSLGRAAACLRPLGHAPGPLCGILTYHRVSAFPENDRQMLAVTPQRLRRQLVGLLQMGYQPWSLRSLVEHHRHNAEVSSRAFAVVFDDGYHGVYRHAWPVLMELGIPATVFLATAYLNQTDPFPFDFDARRSPCPLDRRPLSIGECRAMLASGLIDFGSHTHTHQDFRGRPADFRQDLAASQETLRRTLGLDPVTFSFPYGLWDAPMQRAVRELGLLCGLTAQCDLVGPASDRFSWGRFGATQFDTPRTLAAKLDGWYGRLHETMRRLRSSRVRATVRPRPAFHGRRPSPDRPA